MIEDQMDDITNSVNMSLSKLLELVIDRRPGMLQSMKSQTVRHNWVTELNWSDVEYIMGNDTLDESQDRIKIARRNITSFRYVDDTTLMAESEKEVLMKVKEESEKAAFKLNIQKVKIMASSPITSRQ